MTVTDVQRLTSGSSQTAWVRKRATELFDEMMRGSRTHTDRMFGWLMLGQWVFAIGLALWLSPLVWTGRQSGVHLHVYAAVFLGGLISSLPWYFIWKHPGQRSTRIAVGVAQMLWSGLLVHLTGGRIETHFHIFGSLAFLAFYRDKDVLIPATIVTALDHFLRGILWPESIYGVANPAWWRAAEHAGWVIFCDVFLIIQCARGVREVETISRRQAEAEHLGREEKLAKEELQRALTELQDAQDQMLRTERLAAVGQLAAGVAHELRNPLAAIRNAHTYLGKRLSKAPAFSSDQRTLQFRGIIDRELDACSKIISDLLDFARGRAPTKTPISLKSLVDECMALVPPRDGVSLENRVSDELPYAAVDRDQVRQVFVNLIQNASEAMPEGHAGRVEVCAEYDATEGFLVEVRDNGEGIPKEKVEKIFQPLFSTKTKGTGLGLAIVLQIVERHDGSIEVTSRPSDGTSFFVRFPPEPAVTTAPPALSLSSEVPA